MPAESMPDVMPALSFMANVSNPSFDPVNARISRLQRSYVPKRSAEYDPSRSKLALRPFHSDKTPCGLSADSTAWTDLLPDHLRHDGRKVGPARIDARPQLLPDLRRSDSVPTAVTPRLDQIRWVRDAGSRAVTDASECDLERRLACSRSLSAFSNGRRGEPGNGRCGQSRRGHGAALGARAEKVPQSVCRIGSSGAMKRGAASPASQLQRRSRKSRGARACARGANSESKIRMPSRRAAPVQSTVYTRRRRQRNRHWRRV